MIQQSHCWAYTLRKPEGKETRVPQCSSQHCLYHLSFSTIHFLWSLIILEFTHCLPFHSTRVIKATWSLFLPLSDCSISFIQSLCLCPWTCPPSPAFKCLQLPFKWIICVLPTPGLYISFCQIFFLPFLSVFSSFLFFSSKKDEFFVHWLRWACNSRKFNKTCENRLPFFLKV